MDGLSAADVMERLFVNPSVILTETSDLVLPDEPRCKAAKPDLKKKLKQRIKKQATARARGADLA